MEFDLLPDEEDQTFYQICATAHRKGLDNQNISLFLIVLKRKWTNIEQKQTINFVDFTKTQPKKRVCAAAHFFRKVLGACHLHSLCISRYTLIIPIE